MTKPEDIERSAELAVFAFESRIQSGEFEDADPDGSEARNALKAEIASAILSAVEEENRRWGPAIRYFDRYCQDEADDVENCVCGEQQHQDAIAFREAIRNRKES